MGWGWERDYLNKQIKELRKFLEENKNDKRIAYLAEKVLELYEFQLLLMKYL